MSLVIRKPNSEWHEISRALRENGPYVLVVYPKYDLDKVEKDTK